MNLKIPRLQNITGAVGKSCQIDGAHLEKALRENFLAIERWANQQVTSVCISQSASLTLTPPYGQVTGPWTVLWDQNNLANTAGNKIRVPESGVYLGFAQLFATNIAASTPGTLGWVSVAVGGGSSFFQPALGGQARDSGVTYLSTSSFSAVNAADIMVSFPFLASTAGFLVASVDSNSTQIDERVQTFGFVRLGDTPSKAQ